jgi:hypothetical protein
VYDGTLPFKKFWMQPWDSIYFNKIYNFYCKYTFLFVIFLSSDYGTEPLRCIAFVSASSNAGVPQGSDYVLFILMM